MWTVRNVRSVFVKYGVKSKLKEQVKVRCEHGTQVNTFTALLLI